MEPGVTATDLATTTAQFFCDHSGKVRQGKLARENTWFGQATKQKKRALELLDLAP
jgi:hypothetical protein